MKRYGYFLDLLKLDIEKYPVIAVVGGGGKTSLIYRLNEELQALGKKVIISTTTHMAYDPMLPLVKSTDLEQVSEILKEHGFAAVADIEETSGKMCAIEETALKKLVPFCDVMLIEADGAKRKPLKVPADWEPAIPDFADVVVSVIGLDCLGKPICETAHRAEYTSSVSSSHSATIISFSRICRYMGFPSISYKSLLLPNRRLFPAASMINAIFMIFLPFLSCHRRKRIEETGSSL